MGLFDRSKKEKTALTDEQKTWNAIWELWANGQAASPYAELMTYQSEVNNGGHDQYFFNLENIGSLQTDLAALESFLPETLKRNLQEAYRAYLASGETAADAQAEAILSQCDNVFYENEAEILRLLHKYAERIAL